MVQLKIKVIEVKIIRCMQKFSPDTGAWCIDAQQLPTPTWCTNAQTYINGCRKCYLKPRGLMHRAQQLRHGFDAQMHKPISVDAENVISNIGAWCIDAQTCLYNLLTYRNYTVLNKQMLRFCTLCINCLLSTSQNIVYASCFVAFLPSDNVCLLGSPWLRIKYCWYLFQAWLSDRCYRLFGRSCHDTCYMEYYRTLRKLQQHSSAQVYCNRHHLVKLWSYGE